MAFTAGRPARFTRNIQNLKHHINLTPKIAPFGWIARQRRCLVSAVSSQETFTEEEVRWIRNETPGLRHGTHFNCAGAALPPTRVIDAFKSYFDSECFFGGYEAQLRENTAVQLPYSSLARLLNCSSEEIAIVTSATEAWNQVFHGIAFKPGDIVIASTAEYGSNCIAFAQAAKRYGVELQVVPDTPMGDMDLEKLESLLSDAPEGRIKLVAVSHIPTSSGKVYDAEGIGRLTRRYNVPYLLDACQTVGQMPLDVQLLQCDFLTGTSRKYLRGPRGVGFLYAKKNAMDAWEPAALDNYGSEWQDNSYQMATSAQRYEHFEMSFAAKVGFGVAVKHCNELGIQKIWRRIAILSSTLREHLTSIDGVKVLDLGKTLCGIVSFTMANRAAKDVKETLRRSNVFVSVSTSPSTPFDYSKRGLQFTLRASVHYYNTEQDIETLIYALRTL